MSSTSSPPFTTLRRAGVAGVLTAASFAAMATGVSASTAVTLTAPSTKTIAISKAKQRDCRTAFGSHARGVSRTRWTAPADGYLTVRLNGRGKANDWDVSLFGESGRRLATSAAFYTNEVAQTYVRSGQVIGIQTCRQSGPAKSQRMTTTLARIDLSQLRALAPKQSLVRVSLTGRASFELLQQLGLDMGEDATVDGVSVILHSAAEKLTLTKAGFRFKTVVDDLAKMDQRDRAADARYSKRVGASPVPTGRTTYRTYDETQAELKKLIADYPGLVRPIMFPHKTFQGRDMQGIEIASNVNATDDNRPTFLLVAMHHAREWPTVDTAMEFAWLLAKTGRGDPRIEKILKNTRVVIEPAINADGFIESRGFPIDDPDGSQSAGLIPTAFGVMPPGGYGSYRRKTCDGLIPSGLVPCGLQYGVDPNRNYGQFWGGPGASSDPLTQTYHGTGPWSEPETQSVHEWSRAHDVTSLITLHTVAALVLRPPGLASQGLAPDEPALKKLGDAMAKDTGYTSQYGWQLYDTTGTTEDWNYAAAGTFGYTIEIGPLNGPFHGPYESGVVEQWTGGDEPKTRGKGMRDALLLAAENSFNKVDHSTFTGRAPAGRLLHLHKSFVTQTSDVCLVADIGPLGSGGCNLPSGVQDVPDQLDYTTVVPKTGKFSWIITPSTRPFVFKKGGSEAWTLTCEDPGTKSAIQTVQLVIRVGQTVKMDLPCGGKLPKAKKKAKAKAKHKPKKKHKK
jgi:hypothetical protein